MRILFVGDVFGENGRDYVVQNLPLIKQREKIDFCVVNAENSSHGRGLSETNYKQIAGAGADVITMGNHVWGNTELAPLLKTNVNVIRPGNIGCDAPGVPFIVKEVKGVKVGVANIEGRAFMDLIGDNPFECADVLINKMNGAGATIKLIDFHAEATSEKKLMGLYTDGRVSAVVGTHTHVQTADEQILPKGTAFITDVGMTGISKESVLGMQYQGVFKKIAKGMPARFEPETNGTAEMCAVIITVDEKTGKATEIKRLNEN